MFCSKCGTPLQTKFDINNECVNKICAVCGNEIEFMGYLLSEDEYDFLSEMIKEKKTEMHIKEIEYSILKQNR